MDKDVFKNIKIRELIHSQVKQISSETGLNMGKLAEMGLLQVIEMYKRGEFNNIVSIQKQLRRDGTITRS